MTTRDAIRHVMGTQCADRFMLQFPPAWTAYLVRLEIARRGGPSDRIEDRLLNHHPTSYDDPFDCPRPGASSDPHLDPLPVSEAVARPEETLCLLPRPVLHDRNRDSLSELHPKSLTKEMRNEV